MEEFKVVYTLSDNRAFRLQIFKSLLSLSKFIDKDNIILIVNPPSSKIEKSYGKYATIYDGNEFYKNLNLPNYKFKIEITDIKSRNLIFLDCDTLVMRDIRELLDGDYDFFAREEPCRSVNGQMKPTWDEDIWKYNLKEFEKNTDALPYNDGFMIFKNNLHNKIKDEYLKFYLMYNKKQLKSPNTVDDMHYNEFALSMAVANYHCRNMNEEHHWYGWRNETPRIKPYVIHIGTNKSGLAGYLNNLRRFDEGIYTMV